MIVRRDDEPQKACSCRGSPFERRFFAMWESFPPLSPKFFSVRCNVRATANMHRARSWRPFVDDYDQLSASVQLLCVEVRYRGFEYSFRRNSSLDARARGRRGERLMRRSTSFRIRSRRLRRVSRRHSSARPREDQWRVY